MLVDSRLERFDQFVEFVEDHAGMIGEAAVAGGEIPAASAGMTG